MWHVETDFFAFAIFLLMFIKEKTTRTHERDVQAKAFFQVLVLSFVNVIIDIVSSVAMNDIHNWWAYQVLMTIYFASMPWTALSR